MTYPHSQEKHKLKNDKVRTVSTLTLSCCFYQLALQRYEGSSLSVCRDIHRVSDAIQPSHPLSSPSPPAPNPSQHQGLFKWIGLHIRCPKYWSFSFNISPSNEYSELISFRIDLPWSPCSPRDSQESSPNHTSKASILWHSAFFNGITNSINMSLSKVWEIVKNS